MLDTRLFGQLTDEERMLMRHIDELAARAEDGAPAFSPFLSPRERFILEQSGSSGDVIRFFWGGYGDAERTLACFLPSYYSYQLEEGASPTPELLAPLVREELPITPLRIKASGSVNLSHRDYMGALLGLGLERSVLGDILPDEEGAIIFVLPSIADFLKSELTGIGRDRVKTIDASLPEDFNYTRTFEPVAGTIASPRLDAVLAEVARLSRESAKEMIRRGFVEHNHFTAADPDAPVRNGDVLSVRRDGKCKGGKFRIDSLDERSAKGRVRLKARKYT
ncbi:MAG: hypothetical protein IJ493_00130 [Clostridia bacterium]|nr:hypothetical protein [Clostridia bacterium]